MKYTKKISLLLISTLVMISIFSVNVRGSTIGGQTIGNAGTYAVWQITEKYGTSIADVGDKFNITLKSTGATDFGYGDFPSIGGDVGYFNATEGKWVEVVGAWGTANTMLVYNASSGAIHPINQMAQKYLVNIYPATISLSSVSASILSLYSGTYSGSTVGSNYINFTVGVGGYNFMNISTTGIVHTWIENTSASKLVATYVTSNIVSGSGGNIPFGSEYMVLTLASIVCLVIIVKKKIYTKK